MRQQNVPLLAATATVFLLGACGGDTVLGPGRTVVPRDSEVFALDNTTADFRSKIGGVTLGSSDNTVRIVTAFLPHQTGRLEEFNTGTTTNITMDRNTNGGWNDSRTNTSQNNVLSLNQQSADSLIYSGIFDFTATDPDDSGVTIMGVLTPDIGLRSGVRITSIGDGFVDGVTDSMLRSFNARGVSEITSNFSDGSVSVKINSFDGPDLPFDRIAIGSMQMDGATFDGGIVTLFLDGTEVTSDVLGPNHTTDAAGAFFGLDSREEDYQPREVGGVFVGDGTNGTLSGGFLAGNTSN
jgi:hypothetical protein